MAVTVMSVGDVFADSDDGRDAFRTLESLLDRGDIVFGNCEGVYSERPAKSPSHKHFMGTSTERGSFYGEVGFDVMSLANNHMLDGGYIGMEDTQDLLRGQGIEVTGAGANLDEALRPAVLERDGVKVAFLGCCTVFPKGYEARPSRGGIAPLRVSTAYLNPDENFWEPGVAAEVITRPFSGDLESIEAAIATTKEQADFVVIAPHWGYSSRLVLLRLGSFERGQDSRTEIERAGQRLQFRRVLRPLVVTEIGVARAACDDQGVVGNLDATRAVRQVIDDHVACGEIEPGHLPEDHSGVLLPAHDLAQRHRNLLGRQGSCRDLVGERLEEVEVLPVDQRHLDVGTAEPSHCEDSCEPASDDNDALSHF